MASEDDGGVGVLIGGIVGGVIGAAALVALLTFLILQKKRKQLRKSKENSEISPKNSIPMSGKYETLPRLDVSRPPSTDLEPRGRYETIPKVLSTVSRKNSLDNCSGSFFSLVSVNQLNFIEKIGEGSNGVVWKGKFC